jgi:hypothetical protein
VVAALMAEWPAQAPAESGGGNSGGKAAESPPDYSKRGPDRRRTQGPKGIRLRSECLSAILEAWKVLLQRIQHANDTAVGSSRKLKSVKLSPRPRMARRRPTMAGSRQVRHSPPAGAHRAATP